MLFRSPLMIFAAVILSGAVSPLAGHAAAGSSSDLRFDIDSRSGDPSASGKSGHGHTIRQASDGLFYVDAKVAGTNVRFVVDSGASLVVLTPRDAERIGIGRAHGGNRTMQTSGGMSRAHAETLDGIVVAGQTMNNVDAVVVDSNLQVSLLGQSALSRLKSLRFEGDRLHLD